MYPKKKIVEFMKYKYEDWIMHFLLVFFLIIIYIVMFRKVHNPKDFCKKDFYLKGLSFRFYLSSLIVLGLIFALVKDFIKLYNE